MDKTLANLHNGASSIMCPAAQFSLFIPLTPYETKELNTYRDTFYRAVRNHYGLSQQEAEQAVRIPKFQENQPEIKITGLRDDLIKFAMTKFRNRLLQIQNQNGLISSEIVFKAPLTVKQAFDLNFLKSSFLTRFSKELGIAKGATADIIIIPGVKIGQTAMTILAPCDDAIELVKDYIVEKIGLLSEKEQNKRTKERICTRIQHELAIADRISPFPARRDNRFKIDDLGCNPFQVFDSINLNHKPTAVEKEYIRRLIQNSTLDRTIRASSIKVDCTDSEIRVYAREHPRDLNDMRKAIEIILDESHTLRCLSQNQQDRHSPLFGIPKIADQTILEGELIVPENSVGWLNDPDIECPTIIDQPRPQRGERHDLHV